MELKTVYLLVSLDISLDITIIIIIDIGYKFYIILFIISLVAHRIVMIIQFKLLHLSCQLLSLLESKRLL